jgi:hypothetical protein
VWPESNPGVRGELLRAIDVASQPRLVNQDLWRREIRKQHVAKMTETVTPREA